MEKPLLSIRDLAIDFHTDSGDFRAVDGLSLDIPHGKTVAVVGESGSGKSVTAQAILRILPKAARISAGSIRFNDPAAPETTVDITALGADSERMRALRGGRIAMIFQEPMTSLSPLHTVGDQVTEALVLHADVGREEAKARAIDVFARVGFPDPKRALVTYPFELSGGLRQRAMIAMALIAKPALLIADEPTTALDVTTQAQILDLMKELQADTCMSLMLITHDLGVVANMADEVAVMYRGRVMEAGKREEIFRNPRHPYLQALMRAVPRFDMQPGERLTPIREVRSAALAQKADEPPPPQPAGIVLKAERICKTFTLRSGWFSGRTRTIHAVNGVSLALPRGKTLGLVGESGCGKTTLSKIITRALAARQRPRPVRRRLRAQGRAQAGERRPQGVPARGAVHLPGPVLVPQPAHDGLRDHSPSRCSSTASARPTSATGGPRSCSTWSASISAPCGAIRTRFPAASASVSASPAPLR